MDSSLSQALHSAIGANTRVFLARIVAIDHVDRGRITAFSEFLGNLEVVIGSVQWLRIDDWIFVSRASSEEKYQPYLYLGWAGNQRDITPGSPALFNSTITALPADLPTYAHGARLGEMRSVGGTVGLDGLTTGNTLYIFANINGLNQWVPFSTAPTATIGELVAHYGLDVDSTTQHLTGTGSTPNPVITLDYNHQFFDTYGWVTTGTGWKFLPTVAGQYEVYATMMNASAGAWRNPDTQANDFFLVLAKNGLTAKQLDDRNDIEKFEEVLLHGAGIVYLNGTTDYLSVRVGAFRENGTTIEFTTSSDVVYVYIRYCGTAVG